jgi:L-threonylcarbamoyladenylate synthase
LDLTVDPPQVLRPGGTPFEVLREVLGRVDLNPAVTAEKALRMVKVRSPGLRHKHYAPDAEVVVVEGEIDAVVAEVDELVKRYREDGKRVGVLATDETVAHYGGCVVKSLGTRGDLAVVARNLFRLLREFDAENVEVIIAEGVPAKGLGLAVMNRLRKASGYRIVKTNSHQKIDKS